MKILEIEWKHLDQEGNTCIRCADTGEALQEVIEKLANECKPGGWDIQFKETRLTAQEIPESNMILFNGKPIEDILPSASSSTNHCQSCCDMTGNATTTCRTVEFEGKTYEGIPSHLIRQAACKVAQCCETPVSPDYEQYN